jgi:hypothetical protein
MHYMIAIKVKMLILNRLNYLHELFSKLGGRIIGIIERIGCFRLILGYVHT